MCVCPRVSVMQWPCTFIATVNMSLSIDDAGGAVGGCGWGGGGGWGGRPDFFGKTRIALHDKSAGMIKTHCSRLSVKVSSTYNAS